MFSRNLAVYVHWPFCLKLCPYCSFNKLRSPTDETTKTRADQALTDAILKDLSHTFAHLDSKKTNYSVTSVHFGGGTPSLMSPNSISSIIERVKSCIDVSPNLEIALEGNPSTLTESSLENLKRVGINRLSIGIQSIRDDHLRFLGRDHSASIAWRVLNSAIALFSNERDTISCDLMFGLPNQSPEEWKQDMETVVDSLPALNHLSLYQLTYEPGTPMWREAKKSGFKFQAYSDATAEMYEVGRSIVHSKTMMRQYEVSNYGQPGHESRHNLAYWRGWDYVGVGPGAHGRLSNMTTKSRFRTSKFSRLEEYISKCNQLGSGTQVSKRMEDLAVLKELVVLGLRVREGLSLKNAQELAFGQDVSGVIDWAAVDKFVKLELLEFDKVERVLKPTECGLAVIDSILVDVVK